MAGRRYSCLPQSDALLEVLDDGALALAGRTLDGRERVVVEEPSGIDDSADAKSGSTNHAGHRIDVHHDADTSGAASRQVEFSSEKQLLKVGQLADDFAYDVAAHEGEVAGIGGGFGRGRTAAGVSRPRVAGAVGHEDVIGVGEMGIF